MNIAWPGSRFMRGLAVIAAVGVTFSLLPAAASASPATPARALTLVAGTGDDFVEGIDEDVYLDSLGEEYRSEETVPVGTDLEGETMYSSPLGPFTVDESEVQTFDPDAAEVGVTDVGVNLAELELAPEIEAELEQAGIDLEPLDPDAPPVELPDAELVEQAGICPMDLGDVVVERLEECAAAREGEAPSSAPESGGLTTFSSTASAEEGDYGFEGGEDPGDIPPPPDPLDATAAMATVACQSPMLTVKYLSRKTACVKKSQIVRIHDMQTGVLAGTVEVITQSTLTVNLGNLKVIDQLSARLGALTGVAPSFTYRGTGMLSCGNNCKDATSMDPYGKFNKYLSQTSWATSAASYIADVAYGTAVRPRASWKLTLTAPRVGLFANFGTLAIQPRCDNKVMADMSPGCVFTQVTPTFKFGPSSNAGQVALHVQAAIASGLPSVLTRATQAQINLNRGKACPDSLPKFDYRSCDEYPFASTAQGAGTGYPARVPNQKLCGYAFIAGSGPNGFSRCAVSDFDNTRHGSMTSSFYRSQRILPGDKFKAYPFD